MKIYTQKICLERHMLSCKYRQNNIELEKKDEIIFMQNKTIESQSKKITELEGRLENIAIKGVEKPTTSTSNTQNINLLPLTEKHMKTCASNLTLDHIREGALGYAKYALEYPFKDRLVCVDYARKKIKYKNSDGDYVVDPYMTKMAPKFFKSISSQNNQLINECISEIRAQIEELINSADDTEGGWDVEDFESEQSRLHAFLGILLSAKRNVKEASKNQDNELSDNFVRHVVNTIVSHD